MKNMYLTSTEEKIQKIKFCKACGKVIYSIIILAFIICLFIKLDYVMKMQVDALDQMNYIRQDVEELKSEPKIDDLSMFTISDEERT